MKYFSFLILSFFVLSFLIELNVSAACPCCPQNKKVKGKELIQKVKEQPVQNAKAKPSKS